MSASETNVIDDFFRTCQLKLTHDNLDRAHLGDDRLHELVIVLFSVDEQTARLELRSIDNRAELLLLTGLVFRLIRVLCAIGESVLLEVSHRVEWISTRAAPVVGITVVGILSRENCLLLGVERVDRHQAEVVIGSARLLVLDCWQFADEEKFLLKFDELFDFSHFP